MARSFRVVDLFAGPGGLAEGFSALRDKDGERIFDISLSVEKERSAFATLRLRSFTRQFGSLPDAYYDYIAGRISLARLKELHPNEWKLATSETMMLELGTPEAQDAIDPVLDQIRQAAEGAAILIGGPPCQAYSLVGRARNRGIKDYVASDDPRHFLYREYIRIIDRLRPVAFVMENVKGMLSSRIDGAPIIDRILADLRSAGGGPDSYTLVPLVSGGKGPLGGHIIRCEDYGIPQNRHRVILLGVRSDSIDLSDGGALCGHALEPSVVKATVSSVLSGMPVLRSGLSKSEDGPQAWRDAVVQGFLAAARACEQDGTWLRSLSVSLRHRASELKDARLVPPRSSTLPTPIADNRLGAWLCDPRLEVLPNNETRGHMESDLSRYAFAATFAEQFNRSPKAGDYPRALAPAHENWASGKFADRFRVQRWNAPATTVTSHISKDGHYFIHPDPLQCRSLTVREAARLQTFPDNYFFEGNRTEQYVQVGNAVPPLLALEIARIISVLLQP
jgi:DNA (cytosine-5)-methyltransferase 1